jgi:phospholipid/cholesterol/gamma-HCH transport system ATP-binding protein
VEVLIRLENVSFTSEDFDIIRNVSVSIPRNKTTVIMGGLGSGKSTLLKLIGGIYPPDSGKVFVNDTDFQSLSPKEHVRFRKSTGFAFQDSALWGNSSIYKNISLPLEFHYATMSEKEIEDRIMSLIERIGFHDSVHLRPATLSTGEQKIVSFLRAIVTNPDILFLDDPTQGMDIQFTQKLNQIIKEFKDKGCSIIAVSHDSNLVSNLADYIIILRHGELVESGFFDDIKKSRDQYVRTILSHVLGQATSFDTDLLDLLK